MKAKIIAIVNQKGGVGKTTTTFNLGVGLAQANKRVLLVDADPQSSLTISMGIKHPDELQISLATVMQRVIEYHDLPRDLGIIHNGEGVDLLPSNIALSGIESYWANVANRQLLLRKCLSEVLYQYDYILIDSTPSLGMMTVNALAAADSVIIPSQPNFLSTMGLDYLMHSISKTRHGVNPNLRIDGILLTMVDGRTNHAKDISFSLRDSVKEKIRVFDTEIPHSVRATECPLKGVSIFTHNKKGKVAAAYKLLTQEVIQIEQRQKNRSWANGVR